MHPLSAKIERDLANLRTDQREAFLLKHVEELSYEEIAEFTGASVSASKMRVHRACERLRGPAPGRPSCLNTQTTCRWTPCWSGSKATFAALWLPTAESTGPSQHCAVTGGNGAGGGCRNHPGAHGTLSSRLRLDTEGEYRAGRRETIEANASVGASHFTALRRGVLVEVAGAARGRTGAVGMTRVVWDLGGRFHLSGARQGGWLGLSAGRGLRGTTHFGRRRPSIASGGSPSSCPARRLWRRISCG
jgi:hypothetical protein